MCGTRAHACPGAGGRQRFSMYIVDDESGNSAVLGNVHILVYLFTTEQEVKGETPKAQQSMQLETSTRTEIVHMLVLD